jgi:hypothetical protein
MEHSIAQPDLRPSGKPRNFGATMAAAAGGTLERAIGTRLAAHGQELIRKFREATA